MGLSSATAWGRTLKMATDDTKISIAWIPSGKRMNPTRSSGFMSLESVDLARGVRREPTEMETAVLAAMLRCCTFATFTTTQLSP